MAHQAASRAGLLALLWTTLFLFFPLPPTLSGLELLWRASIEVDAANPRDFVDGLLAFCIGVTVTITFIRPWRLINLTSLLLLLSALGIVLLSLYGADYREPLMAAALWSFFFAATLLKPDDRCVILIVWICILGMQMLVALTAYFLSYNQFITPGFGQRASGLFSNPNALYPWSVIAFFVFLEFARSLPANKIRTVVFWGAIGSFTVLVLTFSRAGWLGLAMGLLTVVMQPFKHNHSVTYRAICLAIALCLICGAATVRTQGAIVSPNNDGSTAGRLRVWRHAFHLWSEHPWFGNGYKAFRWPSDGSAVAGEPKNLVLHVALQSGFVGVLLHGLYFGSVLVLARKIALHSHSAWYDAVIARATFLSVVALLVAGLLDTPVFGPLYRVPPTITLLTFTGLLLAAGGPSFKVEKRLG